MLKDSERIFATISQCSILRADLPYPRENNPVVIGLKWLPRNPPGFVTSDDCDKRENGENSGYYDEWSGDQRRHLRRRTRRG